MRGLAAPRFGPIRREKAPWSSSSVLKQYFTDYEPGVEYEVVFAGRTNGVAAGRLNIINWTAVEDKRGKDDRDATTR
jgi:hypothetical protein